MRFTRSLAVAGILTLAAMPAGAATFMGGSVATNANAFLSTATKGGDIAHHKIVTGGPTFDLAPGDALSQASVTTNGVTNMVKATSKATATWTNANKGTFQSTTTRDMTLPDKSNTSLFAGANTKDQMPPNSSAFDYMFKAGDTDNHLLVDYSTLLTGDRGAASPGMGSWQIVIEDILGGGVKQQVGFLEISGANDHKLFNVALEAGHMYDLKFLNTEDLVLGDANFHNISSKDVATFNFTIDHQDVVAAVPEPASWAMMLGGFGLIGGTLRASRRRPILRA